MAYDIESSEFELDEKYFHDPNWERFPKEKSSAGRARLRRRRIAALKRGKKIHITIAKILSKCEPGRRCLDGNCPECGGAAARAFRETGLGLATDCSILSFSTVQLTCDEALPKHASDLDIREQRDLLAETLRNAGLANTPILGAADFSFDVFAAPIGENRWSCHWSLFTTDRDPVILTRVLSQVIPATRLVPVPVFTRQVTYTPERVFNYAFKSTFKIRHSSGSRDPKDTPPPAQIHHNHPLFLDLAPTLHRIGLNERVYTQNLEFLSRFKHR